MFTAQWNSEIVDHAMKSFPLECPAQLEKESVDNLQK